MGMGRSSGRIASQRLASAAEKAKRDVADYEEESVDADWDPSLGDGEHIENFREKSLWAFVTLLGAFMGEAIRPFKKFLLFFVGKERHAIMLKRFPNMR